MQVTETSDTIKRLEDEARRIEDIYPQLDAKKAQRQAVDGEIEGLAKESGALENELTGLKGQIDSISKTIAELTKKMEGSEPSLRRASQAEQIAEMVGQIVRQTVPSQTQAIAEAMTKAYRKMAHKEGGVHRIAIDKEARKVQMFDANGEDLHNYDLSAGEKQIFTQSLFSAVTAVSGRDFPVVIDTPLSRLDKEHRKGVLKHLATRNNQVILLSTNTEVVGDYLHVIEPNVQAKFRLDFDDEKSLSSVSPGYFDDAEVSP